MSVFGDYISNIEQDYKNGKATEYTYRSALETFMESLARGIQASNDPKHIDCGAPDFIVERGKVPLGYVETKDVGADLDKVETSDQMKRYLKALNNLILTDYLEFRWFVNGEKKRTVRVASSAGRKLRVEENAETQITQLFQDFYATETPTVNTPKELAGRLASVTHFIREQIRAAMEKGEERVQKGLTERFNVFRELLLPALTADEFSDLYAQAMTYGLFAAKLSAPEGEKFTLSSAYQFLFGNKFLRRLFSDVSEELDEIEIIRPYLLDIVSLLNRADFHSILADFGRRTKTEDPVVHFYETFLAAYDPKLRESRGVFYTPEPAVQFIVNGIHHLLKTRFHLRWGLADPSVKVLDPATGTGTFLFYVIQKIHEEIARRRQSGQWKQKSKELLQRVFGFELLIAPYVVSHLKLGLLLKELGAPLEGKDERLHVYLTNTLDEGVTRAEQLAGLGHYIAEESSEAAHVKKQQPIMVVMGNPPYSNFGMMNKSQWIMDLLQDYKRNLNEKKINLDDDYIKFLRFGQWRIQQTGQGVLAFITNNSFIDGLTHRQMRKSLMETFTDIYILDLHGNSKRQEVAPDGSKDENVFDIQQGVCISLFVKEPNKKSPARVHHAELWGSRELKYQILSDSELDDIEWKTASSIKDNFFFVVKDFSGEEEYKKFTSLTDMFIVSQGGFTTDRDELFIDENKKRLLDRMKEFYSEKGIHSPFSEIYNVKDSSGYPLLKRRKSTSFDPKYVEKCTYRPFEHKLVYYNPNLISRPGFEGMKHMVGKDNLGLCAMRQVVLGSDLYSHFFVTEYILNDRSLLSNRGRATLFPLYLYTTPEETAGTLFAQSETTRRPNLAPEFIQAVEAKLKLKFDPNSQSPITNLQSPITNLQSPVTNPQSPVTNSQTFTPEDVFHYAYAVFHSPTYRTRYAEFLKIDFPRLPITSDKKLFRKLAKLGAELVALHLLKSPKVDDFITTYPAAGENKVEKVAFVKGKVYINATQYFGQVPQEVWEFKVGGYQVCEKWLKDRKGRILTGEDITHYQRVVVALKETIRLMKEIDKAIPKFPIE